MTKSTMIFLFFMFMMLLSFLLEFSRAEAQTPTTLSISIDKAYLTWDWGQGEGGPADGFDVHCGLAAGVYNPPTRYVGSDVRSVPVIEVVPGVGTWFCAVTAYNEFDLSGPSNEVSFKTGLGPEDPSNTRIEGR